MDKQNERPSVKLELPISTRLLQHSETKVDNRTETLAQIEVVGSNGVKHLTNAMLRSVQTDEKISRVLTMWTRKFASKDNDAPAHSSVETIFTDISMGEIEGDQRWATIESTIVSEAGIQKFPPHRIKKPLVSPYSGVPAQQVTDEVLQMITKMNFPIPK